MLRALNPVISAASWQGCPDFPPGTHLLDEGEKMSFRCECSDPGCQTRIDLELGEMLFLRRTNGSVVIPGHESPADEIIGWDSDERYVLVREVEAERKEEQWQ